MSEKITPGIKLIRHNGGNVNNPDDPSLPWRLEASFRPPEFMSVAFVFLYGGEELIVVRGDTKEHLEEFVQVNDLRNHPRLKKLAITQPRETK